MKTFQEVKEILEKGGFNVITDIEKIKEIYNSEYRGKTLMQEFDNVYAFLKSIKEHTQIFTLEKNGKHLDLLYGDIFGREYKKITTFGKIYNEGISSSFDFEEFDELLKLGKENDIEIHLNFLEYKSKELQADLLEEYGTNFILGTHTIELSNEPTLEEYLSILGQSQRRKFKKSLKAFEEGKYELEIIDGKDSNDSEIDSNLQIAFDMNTYSFGIKHVLKKEKELGRKLEAGEFNKEMEKGDGIFRKNSLGPSPWTNGVLNLDKRKLKIFKVYESGKIIACLFVLNDGNKSWFINGGFATWDNKDSLNLVWIKYMEDCFKHKIRQVEMMGYYGNGYKKRFGGNYNGDLFLIKNR